jgi:hypothetical protein
MSFERSGLFSRSASAVAITDPQRWHDAELNTGRPPSKIRTKPQPRKMQGHAKMRASSATGAWAGTGNV